MRTRRGPVQSRGHRSGRICTVRPCRGRKGGREEPMLGSTPGAGAPDLIARRRELGIDLLDEVWDGVYVVAPGPNAAHALVERELAVEPHARRRGLVGSGLSTWARRATSGARRRLPRHPPVCSCPRPRSWSRSSVRATGRMRSSASPPRTESGRSWSPTRTAAGRVLAAVGRGYRRAARSALIGLNAAEVARVVAWP